MIALNGTRADFAEKFEELIASYNAGSRSIDDLFSELLKLSHSLNDEQQRHVRENVTEEELVIFDILTRPAPELSADERAEVKKVARELLARLKVSTGARSPRPDPNSRWPTRTRRTPAYLALLRQTCTTRNVPACSSMFTRTIRNEIWSICNA